MALKLEGYACSVWDEWSRRDSKRYHTGECWHKWETFKGAPNPVTGATIVQMAKERGWRAKHETGELAWDAVLSGDDDGIVVREGWVEKQDIQEPKDWSPTGQIITYLETLFEPDEYVSYVMDAQLKKGDDGKPEKWVPANKGSYNRTCRQLIASLKKYKDDIGAALGDFNPEAGAWIRFNPMDGEGVQNKNVADFRYALVESDEDDIPTQNAILRELELPIAVLVHSGSKSLHAIVHIDAPDQTEYQRRVDYLYDVCAKNRLTIDRNDRNASRLSRMPGIMRSGKKQFIVDTNIGKKSWAEWKEWIESVNDDLPEIVSMDDIWNNIPPLAEPLIDGVLRKGHKMLLAGPSKAGKSYSLIELCIAIASGDKWFGFQCTKGSVLYVDLELDKASCYNRFDSVRKAMHKTPEELLGRLEVWNLRGRACTMDKLAPKLIRRILKRNKTAEENLSAVIIDPIYKVLTGDENNASDMGKFCNLFDKVATEANVSVIYCHHHSKGAQGGKRAMDRSSGSGVFARDPDAVLDMIELVDLDPDVLQGRSAWRLEGALREFRSFEPVNVWYDNPLHILDTDGVLSDAKPDSAVPYWQKGGDKNKSKQAAKKTERDTKLIEAYEAIARENNGVVTTRQMMAEMEAGSMQTIRNWITINPFMEYDTAGIVHLTYGDGWDDEE